MCNLNFIYYVYHISYLSLPLSLSPLCHPHTPSLQVQGTQEEKEFDLESFGERGRLYYERYFYIAASATFPGRGCGPLLGNQGGPASELVLDVPQGTAVIFWRKVMTLFQVTICVILMCSKFYIFCAKPSNMCIVHTEKLAVPKFVKTLILVLKIVGDSNLHTYFRCHSFSLSHTHIHRTQTDVLSCGE